METSDQYLHTTEHHITDYPVYAKILIALLILLSVSVLAAYLNLKQWVIVIAMLISCIKVSLVLTWFMHLKYDRLVIKLMVGLTFLVIIVIFILMFFDYWFR